MKRIILIIIVVVIILGGGAVYYFYYWPTSQTNENINAVNNNSGIEANNNLNTNAALNVNATTNENTNTAASTDEQTISGICLIFAERYGSYSTTNDFQHLIDLKSYMSNSLQKETDDYITLEEQKAPTQEFLAVFSKSINTAVSGLTASKATCQATLQRTERNETTQTADYFQNLLLQFIKEEGDWRVNQVTWQEKINF